MFALLLNGHDFNNYVNCHNFNVIKPIFSALPTEHNKLECFSRAIVSTWSSTWSLSVECYILVPTRNIRLNIVFTGENALAYFT
jgi:hypothetical protein